MSRLVFVYSIQRESAFGVDQWTSASGVNLKKSKIGNCTDSLKALYSTKQGGLANYISYTPWIEDGKQKVNDKGHALTLQSKLEQKWNKPENYFSNEALSKGDNKPDGERTYFQRMSWKLNDGCTVFDLDTMDGEMGYYMLLGSSKVANSEKEWRTHMWPKAEWYIALENESESIKAQKNQSKIKAFTALSDTKLTDSYRRKIISLLNLSSSRTTLTNEQVNNLLVDYIDRSSFTAGSNIDKFMELYTLLTTVPGREELEARFLLAQAIDNRLIFERQGSYTWVRPQGQVVIGERFQEAVDFLLNPKKQPEVEELTAAIKSKNS
jgi:hypothetical protein